MTALDQNTAELVNPARKFMFGIDPGSKQTGWACFKDGICVETGTIIPPEKAPFLERCLFVAAELKAIFTRFAAIGVIAEVAVEEFVDYAPREKAKGIRKAERIAGICLGVANDWAERIREVGKGSAPKDEAVMLCRALKIKVDTQDAADAVHLGLLAGFDSPTSTGQCRPNENSPG